MIGLYLLMLREKRRDQDSRADSRAADAVLAVGAGGRPFTSGTLSQVTSTDISVVSLDGVGHYAAMEARHRVVGRRGLPTLADDAVADIAPTTVAEWEKTERRPASGEALVGGDRYVTGLVDAMPRRRFRLPGCGDGLGLMAFPRSQAEAIQRPPRVSTARCYR